MNSLFIGRYQPLHRGHISLIRKVLQEGKRVVVAIRDTSISSDNPYTLDERVRMFKKVFDSEIRQGVLKIITIPDISEVCYGRKVGWKIRRVRLNYQLEGISATKIRNLTNRVLWLTGNVGSGKTALAYLLKERLNAIVLDGDEMRASISLGAGFSKEEREEHNLRVARLALILNNQGFNVIVSVIAPYRTTRKKIEKICSPYWIYIKGGEKGKDKPYEFPKNPIIVIDPSKEPLLESVDKIVRKFSRA